MTGTGVTLYSYWRSQASYRVRIALALKGVTFETVSLDLLKGDQGEAAYRALNAGMAVPTLVDGNDMPLVQSLAILEYLDETRPKPPLLPREPHARARARALAQMVAMDAHPFIVPRVRQYMTAALGLGAPAVAAWVRHWLDEASRALEETLARGMHPARFCCGDEPTIADICLAAHFVSTGLFGARGPEGFPHAARVFDACMALDAFSQTHPLKQPDVENLPA
jgi:maleylacetoacetate isomerase